jgi:putative membrane protein
MESIINFSQLLSAVIYTIFGSFAFAIAFKVLNWLTPNDFWHEILEEHNQALAIVVGAISIGLAIIISAAVKG